MSGGEVERPVLPPHILSLKIISGYDDIMLWVGAVLNVVQKI
jgi:hypothetical protein